MTTDCRCNAKFLSQGENISSLAKKICALHYNVYTKAKTNKQTHTHVHAVKDTRVYGLCTYIHTEKQNKLKYTGEHKKHMQNTSNCTFAEI